MDFASDEEISFAHDVLLKGHPAFDDEKIKIIKCNESKDIRACPGSGKTTTLLAKLVILAHRMPLPDGKGICVLTHTNVAIDEIKSKLNSQADVLFNYPNYFGTIQGFVDKFLTIPFYNSISNTPLATIDDEKALELFTKYYYMKTSNERGSIEAYIQYHKRSISSVDFLFNLFYDPLTGNFLKNYGYIKPIFKDQSKSTYKFLCSTRGRCLNEGILKYEDTFAYAITYCKQCDMLKEAISERFNYLFIDEMQDTNNIQFDLLDMLFDKSKTIVQRLGDPHQAIYEKGEVKWHPKSDSLIISRSMRFGDKIATILKSVCDENNSDLLGNKNIDSLTPILIVYTDPASVLPKFAELVKERKIGGKTIFEINSGEMDKDPLHRYRIKAVGWVGKDKKYSISTYYPSYLGTKSTRSNESLVTLCDFLRKPDTLSTKDCVDNIFTALSTVLELSGIMYEINGKSIRYTKSRLQSFLERTCPDVYQELRVKVSKWCLSILNDRSSICVDIYNQIKGYIENDFYKIFEFNKNDERYKGFIREPDVSLFGTSDDSVSGSSDVYTDNGVEIEVGTVHSVKGETHIATLYMETSFYDKCESQRIGDQLCGCPYSGKEERVEKTLRIAHVAMSRPKYMLCMAIQKGNFVSLDRKRLSQLWEIIEI